MQIHEITEGLLSNISRGFVQGAAGVDLPKSQPPVNVPLPKTATATQTPATERIVVTVTQPGQTVPSQYYKVKNAWSNELGASITDPRQTAYLDKLIPTHGKKETIATPPVARKISRRRIAQ
jgi:hypothetical protein